MARKKSDNTPVPVHLDESTVLDVQNILSLQKTLAEKTERVKDEIKEAKAALARKLHVSPKQITELLKSVKECSDVPEMLDVKKSIVKSTEMVITA